MRKINAKVSGNAPAQSAQSGPPSRASGLGGVVAAPGTCDTPFSAWLAKITPQTRWGHGGTGSPPLSVMSNLGPLESDAGRTQLPGRARRLLLSRPDCAGAILGRQPGCGVVYGDTRLQRAGISGRGQADPHRGPCLGRCRSVHRSGSDDRRGGRCGGSSGGNQRRSGLDNRGRQPGTPDRCAEVLS